MHMNTISRAIKKALSSRRTSLNQVECRIALRGHFALGVTGILLVDQRGSKRWERSER
ncbi:hypothetical protein M405DRAFT_804488 [Rhizopogon salebrosus TDB-379]|nr:hypothetical protein M405DRAFT_804488 [Rhizopogon salebrosus TDB-379]